MLKTIAVALLLGSCAAQDKPCADIAEGNGRVDIEDLLGILSAYGSSNAKVNVVGSNKIDIEDLLAVLGQYGEKCSRKSDSAKTGMYFEAFHHNGGNLARRGSPLWRSWNGMKAFVTHPAHAKDVWFSNDNDFKKEIPKFNKNNQYLMRWSGEFNAPVSGTWRVKTTSDDGSRVYVDGMLIVDNDGDHGMRTKEYSGKMIKGWHKLVIVFYENGGGAGLQVSVAAPKQGWQKLTAGMTRPIRLPTRVNLVQNGGFEANKVGGYKYTAPSKWKTDGKGVIVVKSKNKPWGGMAAPAGSYFVSIQGKGKYVQQNVKTVKGKVYTVSFMATHRPGYGNNEKLNALIDGKSAWMSRHPGNQFTPYSFKFKAAKTSTTLRFENDSPNGDRSIFLDGVTVYLSADQTPPPPKGSGLYFEAFHKKNGKLANWGSPLYTKWDNMKPIVSHKALTQDVWYSSDSDFKKEIPGFNKDNQYIMRWAGDIGVPADGKWKMKTNSDDGSRVYVNNKLVVENDGDHGMTTKEGAVTLKKGWAEIVIVFYENGGGAGLQVSIAGPGQGWTKLTASMCRPGQLAEPQGMYFEAFDYKGGKIANWGSPMYKSYNDMKPIVSHTNKLGQLWYSNDNDFKKDINGFKKDNKYIMRWSGKFMVQSAGTWKIKTTSDDGSRVFVDGKLVVDNDGNHGMKTKQGAGKMTKGWHSMVVVFYEDGGGAGLQVSVDYGAGWKKLTAEMTTPVQRPEYVIVKNGNFEADSVGGYKYMAPKNWEKSKGGVVVVKSKNGPWGSMAAGNGGYFISIQSAGSYVQQSIKTIKNKWYQVKFMATHRPGYGNDEKIVALIDGKKAWSSRHPGNIFTTYQFRFKASRAATTLRFQNDSPKGDRSVFLDHVRVTVSGSQSPPPPPDQGLYFEAFHHKGGKLANWGSPLYTTYNNMKPIVSHSALQKDVWYSNDNDFKKEINGFNKNNAYIMRWAGEVNLNAKGTWKFQTNSDDGSRLYIDGKLVVENDGDHGMTKKEGKIAVSKGAHEIVIVFYENGGGAGLQVQLAAPGKGWKRLTSSLCKASQLAAPEGLYFEAFKGYPRDGKLSNMGSPLYRKWNNMKPIVAHANLAKDLWYSNDNDFKKEINGFKEDNKYIMRWSGRFYVQQAGTWKIKTTSDDGSQVFVDGRRIVDNDGNHGMKTKQGAVKMTKGWHSIVITFFENGGGAGLQVSVDYGAGWKKLTSEMTTPTALPIQPGTGLFFEAYDYKSGQLSNWGSPLGRVWNKMNPSVSHAVHTQDVWYSNDEDFKKEIKGFNKDNKYIMRWTGMFLAEDKATYGFRTTSDDGSRLYINGKRVVDNDGKHGMRTREGKIALNKGRHSLVITFFEDGGGAGLQVSVKGKYGGWGRLAAEMTRPKVWDLAVNGDFEANKVGSYTYMKPTGWQTAGSGVVCVKSKNKPWGGKAAGRGGYFISIQGKGKYVQQTVKTTKGKTYRLSFMATHRPGQGNKEKLVVKVDGKTVWAKSQMSDNYKTYTLNLKASKTQHIIRFENDSPKGDQSVFLDFVQVTPQ